MPKLDEIVGEVAGFTIFKKAESPEYELAGPAVPNSPLAYTFVRVTPKDLERLNQAVQNHSRK